MRRPRRWLRSRASLCRRTSVVAQQPAPAQKPATQQPARPHSRNRPPAAAPPSPEFEKLAESRHRGAAGGAMGGGDRALRQARQAEAGLRRGVLVSGHGVLHADDFPRCRETFRKVVTPRAEERRRLTRSSACASSALKEYDRSLQHLLQSRILGIGDVPDLGGVARYHAAILMSRMEQYEQALETLGEFAGEGNDNPRVIEAMGIATLRMPLLPIETPPDRREMILMAGRASYLMATRNTAAAERAFEQLVTRVPGDAERPLRLRRLPAPGEGREGDRGVQARARDPAGSSVVADADGVRVPQAGRCGGGAADREAGGRRGAERVLRAQGARPGAARQRRCRRRHPRAAGRPEDGARQSRVSTSASRAPTSAPDGSKTPRASATSSRGSIGWRGRSAAAHSRSADI